jgi:hypothetical protein
VRHKSYSKKIRIGQHGVRSAKQAIAIDLSEALRAGVDLTQPKKGTVSEKTRIASKRASARGKKQEPISKKRSKIAIKALEKEATSTVS